MQLKIQDLERKVEVANHNEQVAYMCLEKVTKQLAKFKAEKEFYEDVVITFFFVDFD